MAQYGPTKIDINKIKQSIASKTPVKEVVGSVSTQQPMQSTLQPQTQRTQATSTIGGLSSPFGATNINNKPTFPGATPAQLGEEQKIINETPKVTIPTKLPETGSEQKVVTQDKLKEIMQAIPDRQQQKEAIRRMQARGYAIEGLDAPINKSSFVENLGSGIAQSVTGFGNLGKSLAFGAVDLYRKAQGKEELTPEQKAQVEQTPMGQALNTITNRQTPEQKASAGGQIGMVAGSVAQGAALGTPISNAVSKIPGVANIVSKAPILSKIAGGIGQGLEGQAQYNLSAEGRLPTGKELVTAGAFGGAVNAIGPIARGIKEMKTPKIGSPTEYIAKKITGTIEPQGKLFKAQEPRTNQLNKAVDYKKLRANSDIANEEILKAGYKPTDTASRAVAHADTMKKIWNEEIQSKVGNQFDIDLNPIADSIDEFIAKQKTAGLIKNQSQLAELKAQADQFRKMGKVNGADAEFTKEMINAQINNRGDSSIGDVYKNGMKEATKKLGAILDDTFSTIPGEFAEAKRKFGALKATYQDVVKADIKAQKAKGLGLGETFGRIEGFGDIVGSLGGIVTGKNPIPGLLQGGAKVFMGKVLGKVKDKDFLIEQGFEELSKKIKPITKVNQNIQQGLKYPIKLSKEGIMEKGATLPKSTIKGNVTAETGKIGISYPKVIESAKNAPKTTVAPSVSAPKVDTFKRLTELDTDPSFKKITGREPLGGGKIKQGLYETEHGPIQSTFMDRTIEKVKVGDKTFNRGDVNIFEKTPIDPAKIAGEKALQELKTIEQGQGKTFASNLRSILDDFGIKKVDDIPEGSEQDILQMVRARKVNTSKLLGKETISQSIKDGYESLASNNPFKELFTISYEKGGKLKGATNLLDPSDKKAKTLVSLSVGEINKNRLDELLKLSFNGDEPRMTYLEDLIPNGGNLYKLYPGIKHLDIEMNPRDIGKSDAYFNGNKIGFRYNKDMSMKDIRGNILHEIQHYIQHTEGFNIGGNTNISLENIVGTLRNNLDWLNNNVFKKSNYKDISKEEAITIRDKINSYINMLDNIDGIIDGVVKKGSDYISLNEFKKIIKDLNDQYLLDNEDVFNHYRAIGGEIESRMLQGDSNKYWSKFRPGSNPKLLYN